MPEISIGNEATCIGRHKYSLGVHWNSYDIHGRLAFETEMEQGSTPMVFRYLPIGCQGSRVAAGL